MEIKRYQLLSEAERNFAGNLVSVMSITTQDVDISVLDVQPDDVGSALLIAVDTIKDLKATNNELQEGLSTTGRKLQSTEVELKLSNEETQRLTSELETSKGQNMALAGELDKQKAINEKLRADVKIKDEEVVSLTQNLQKYAAAYSNQKREIESKTLEIQELRKQLETNSSHKKSLNQVEFLEDLYQRLLDTRAFDEAGASTAAKLISIGIQTLGQNPKGRRVEWVRENSTTHMSWEAFQRKSMQQGTTLTRMDVQNPKSRNPSQNY